MVFGPHREKYLISIHLKKLDKNYKINKKFKYFSMGISKETDGRCLITLSRDCLYSRTLSFLSWLRYTSYPPRASPPGGVTGRPALSCSKFSFSFCYQDKVRLNKANSCYKAPYPQAWMDDTHNKQSLTQPPAACHMTITWLYLWWGTQRAITFDGF